MKKGIFVLAAIVLIVLSGMAVCSALPPPPPPPSQTTAPPQTTAPYQTTTPPQTTAPPSGGLQSISESEVVAIGGEPPEPYDNFLMVISGIQIWILDPATGQWTFNPINMNLNANTWLLIENDQYQTISTEETYPTGRIDWRDWGWFSQGYYYYRFMADTPGQHRVVAVGGNTGRSNELTVNVIGGGGGGGFTVNAWPSSSYYTIGSPSCIYFTVNKPCWARVTYIKQNSNIVWSGPTYVSAGTHTDRGTIGSPRGTRTVVVDGWTSSGEYAYDVTSYNVG